MMPMRCLRLSIIVPIMTLMTVQEGDAQLRPDVAGPEAAVVADHPIAAAAGAEVLRRGGNAMDAAITMAAVLAHNAAIAQTGATPRSHTRHDLDVQQLECDLARLKLRRTAGLDSHPRIVRV